MAMKLGKCRNYGNCDVADLNRIVEAAEDNFVCPECGRKLAQANPKPSLSPSRSKLLPVLAAVLVLAGVIGFLVWKYTTPPATVAPVNPPPSVSETTPPPVAPTPAPSPVAPARDADKGTNTPSGNETVERIRNAAGKQ